MRYRRDKIEKEKIKQKTSEPKVIRINLSLLVGIIAIIMIVLSSLVSYKVATVGTKMMHSLVEEIEADESLLFGADSEDDEIATASTDSDDGELGEYAYISSAVITDTITGVAPFDDESDTDSSNSDGTVTWTAGNDTSEDDNIVRSFDQITWELENTFVLNDNATEESYTGGTIEVTATLPEECEDMVQWDTDSMNWAENATVSDDGLTFTVTYTMSSSNKTVPGKQTLIFICTTDGSYNGLEIVPTFTIGLTGNDESEYAKVSGDAIYVSAAPSYNIKLVQNSSLQKKVTVDYGDGDTSGRMYGYALIYQLYNQSSSKGLKGIEYPSGDITCDIEITLLRTDFDGTETDITDSCTPVLWNYNINNSTDYYGVISDRIMYWGNSYHRYASNAPYGTLKTYRESCVYDSGNVVMTQNESTISVTISDYDFDGTFPIYNYSHGETSQTSVVYTENIGCFSVPYFQIFVPDNEESTVEDANYYLTVKVTNFSASSTTGTETTTEQVSSDNSNTLNHVLYKAGSYTQSLELRESTGSAYLSSRYNTGDAYAKKGQTIRLDSKNTISLTSDYDIYSVIKFIKFDGDCFEPVLWNSSGTKYTTDGYAGTMTFNVWYATKQDGTNWENQTEMNNGDISDMLLYENIEDIPDGYICIGVYFESTADEDGYLAVDSGDNNRVCIKLKIKDTATIGQTYGITQYTTMWIDYVDRSIYSIIYNNVDEWPTYTWSSGYKNYVKTEYDEDGNIITGTHNGGNQYGQTVLVIGGELTISKTSEQTNYDFSNNEYDVTYTLTPNIDSDATITGLTLKITDTLPDGMTYVAGSSSISNSDETYEPDVTENSDGTTTLVWYMYDVSSDNIPTITYTGHLDETLSNGDQLTNTAVVAEVPATDDDGNDVYYLGNTEVTNRTYEYTVQVINLSSYAVYKTTETPVIEVNGEIHYKITVLNKTDDALDDFQLLDILPYIGDGRGTDYNGTYTVTSINLTETDTTTDEEQESELSIYITNDESVRTDVTVKDTDLGTSSIWSEYTNGETLGEELTAYAVTGSLGAYIRLEIDIYLQTSGNRSGDLYKNSATAQTNEETEEITTSIITVQDVKRELYGYVWYDEDNDGLIDEDEEYLEGVEVTLLNSDGTVAYDVSGNEISTITTDENGYYYFEDMVRGDYIVVMKLNATTTINGKSISLTDGYFTMTEKEVGQNTTINSKFNTTTYNETDEYENSSLDDDYTYYATDTIETLNSIESPEIIESYVNAGITPQTALITITKVAQKSTSTTLEGVTFNLYKLICEDSSHEHDTDEDLIDVDEYETTCWELVGTYTTDENGQITLGIYETDDDGNTVIEGLLLTDVFRLVETSTIEDYLLPEGQWKIEFDYGNLTDDSETIDYNGTIMKVTAISNPPALSLDSNLFTDDVLYLYNKASYDVPTTGSFGIDDYIKIGLIIILIGMIDFIRKKRKEKENEK